jgi:SAM-dependent methyltransferase
MHTAAFNFYEKELKDLPPLDVLEFGSYNINGSVRDAYPQAKSWWGIDIAEGNGVDEVADAAIFKSDTLYDIVICAEAFEHTEIWRDIIENAWEHLKPDGLFLASCATKARPPHSAFDGGALREGEYYHNVHPTEMEDYMKLLGWENYSVDVADGYFGNDDLYIKAVK